jgi:hypothetical protein
MAAEVVAVVGVKELFKMILSVILVYSTHYGTAKIYDNICVPDGISGYLQGFITTSSPWCKMALEIMKSTENHYSTVILVGLSRLLLAGVGI